MNVGLSVLAFAVGAVVSLGAGWVLVSLTRLERVGESLRLSEALLRARPRVGGHRSARITASNHRVAAPPSNGWRRGCPWFQRVQLGGPAGPGSGRQVDPPTPQGRRLQWSHGRVVGSTVPPERGAHSRLGRGSLLFSYPASLRPSFWAHTKESWDGWVCRGDGLRG